MHVVENRGEGLLERQQLLGLLERNHTQITSVLGEAEVALNSSDPARSKSLALVRWQLMRHLRSYQLFKHGEIFDPICRSKDVARAKQASVMKTRCVAAGEAYEEHVRKWSAGGIDGAWSLYENEAREMIALIRRHLSRERAEVDALLANAASPRSSAKLTA